MIHEMISSKIILLGNSGVGKSSLANRWISDSHIGNNLRPTKPTIGVNNIQKTVQFDGKEAVVALWDTAGQEKFRSLTPIYSRSCTSAIIVVSVIDSKSIESITQWVDMFVRNCESRPMIFLVINKIDMPDCNRIDRNNICEKYLDTFSSIFFGFIIDWGRC